MNVGIVQLRIPCYEVEKNQDKILSYVLKAKSEGADLVIFPEAANLGYIVLDNKKRKEYSSCE